MNRYPSRAISSPHPPWLVFLVVLAVIGCGKPEKTGTVFGTVTYQGKPLPVGTVTFLDSNNQWLGSSVIRGEGQYRTPAGVPTGPAKITIKTPGPRAANKKRRLPEKERPESVRGGLPRSGGIAIPAKYGDPDQSGLSYTVQPGSQEYNIELK